MNDIILKKDENKEKYDLTPLNNLDFMQNEENQSDLLKFIKKVQLSSNKSFYNDCAKKFSDVIEYTIIKNVIFFGIIQSLCFIVPYFFKNVQILKHFFDPNCSNSLGSIFYRLIFFGFPELFVLFVFKGTRFYMKYNFYSKNMSMINEVYQFNFNNNPKSKFICKKINHPTFFSKDSFDIHLEVKNKHNKKKSIIYYRTPLSFLKQNFFYDYIIIYSIGSLYSLCKNLVDSPDFYIAIEVYDALGRNNMNFHKEMEPIMKYKYYINLINIYLGLSIPKWNTTLLIILKFLILIFEVFLDYKLYERNRDINLEQFKKKMNDTLINKGYFFDINDDISTFYKINEKYLSPKYDYQFFCKQTNKLIYS